MSNCLVTDGNCEMYHRVRRKMRLVVCAILILVPNSLTLPTTDNAASDIKLTTEPTENYENNVIDFDDEFSVKFSNRYDVVPWDAENDKHVKESHRYTIVKDDKLKLNNEIENKTEIVQRNTLNMLNEATTEIDYSVIPLELVSTTENYLVSIIESTTDHDLSVIPLSTTVRVVPDIQINQTVTLPTSTQESDTTTDIAVESYETTTEGVNTTTDIVQTIIESINKTTKYNETNAKIIDLEVTTSRIQINSVTEIVNTTLNTNSSIYTNTSDKKSNVSEINTIANEDFTVTANTETILTLSTVVTNDPEEMYTTVQTVDRIDSNVETTTVLNIKANVTREINVTSSVITNSTEIANVTTIKEILKTNSSKQNENVTLFNIASIEVSV